MNLKEMNDMLNAQNVGLAQENVRLQFENEKLRAVKEAGERLLKWAESEIHNEYDGTGWLNERLAELDFMREAVAACNKKEGV